MSWIVFLREDKKWDMRDNSGTLAVVEENVAGKWGEVGEILLGVGAEKELEDLIKIYTVGSQLGW